MPSASRIGPATPQPEDSKRVWRAWARQRRSGLEPTDTGRRIAEQLAAWDGYRAASRVLIYLAFGNEPDLTSLVTDASKHFYTTRTPGDGQPLTLHRLDPGDLERHRFGFMQPSPSAAHVAVSDVELALIPGLAFDMRGNRLGFGLGYYDRFLGSLGRQVPLIGVVPSALLVPRLPVDPHDVRMTHLASEDGIIPVDAR